MRQTPSIRHRDLAPRPLELPPKRRPDIDGLPGLRRSSQSTDLTWLEPKTRKTRGAVHRTQIFLVPETERTTRFHVFVHLHFERRLLRMFTPALKPISVALAYREILDDARFIPIVADTPEEITGMRLSKFDKPVVHNRRLLRRIYWNRQEESTQSTPGGRRLEVTDDAG